MRAWVKHALIYITSCTMISLVWVLLTSGTVDDLEAYVRTPADAFRIGFWPIWFWLFWGTAVAIHFIAKAGRLIPGGRRRRRRRRHRRSQRDVAARAARHAARQALAPTGPRSPTGRRHVVAMFTDLTGSTTANEQLGDEAWAGVVGRHRMLVRAAVAANNGIEVGTQGDGFFVRFDRSPDATACAVQIQRQSAEERLNGSFVPAVRVGIHGGDAVHEDDDVLGQVVNVAARLLEVAEPNEILVTESVADAVDDGRFEDRGLVDLKGLSKPRHLLALYWG